VRHERGDLADEERCSGDVDQAEAVERGEVREVLGVEGSQRQFVGQAAGRDPGVVAGRGRPRC
jgi:hypothetical protein